jgi:hypothetical protein
MSRPFLHELAGLQPGNDLYAGWLEYVLSLTEDDIKGIVRRGLTYQAESLRSMVRELIAGGAAPPELFRKLDLVVLATRRHADNIR